MVFGGRGRVSVGTVLPVTQQNVTHSWHLSFYQWYKISSWGIFSPITWRFHLNFFLILIQFRKFLHTAFQKPLVSIFLYLPFPPHNPPILVSPLSVYKTIIYFCFVERFPTPFLVPYCYLTSALIWNKKSSMVQQRSGGHGQSQLVLFLKSLYFSINFSKMFFCLYRLTTKMNIKLLAFNSLPVKIYGHQFNSHSI